MPKRLSLIRGFGVQLSTAFIGIAMPPTVGHMAINARCLHRQDVDEGTIAAAVTMSQAANVVTTVLLLIVFGLLTGSGLSRSPKSYGRTCAASGPRLLHAISRPLRLAISAGVNLLLTAAYLVAFIAALRAVGVHPAILPAAVVYLAGNAVGSAARGDSRGPLVPGSDVLAADSRRLDSLSAAAAARRPLAAFSSPGSRRIRAS